MASRAHIRALPLPAVSPAVTVAAGLLLLGATALVLRTQVLGAGYWTDEAISVGIASRPLADIPATLRLDGSPPLYYLLLHGWMALFGTAEAATRSLSLVTAVAAVPVAFAAGRAAGRDDRAGWLAAGAVATMPFLTAYAQETRMYALVVLLSLAATGCFAALLRTGGRGPAVGLGLSAIALLYTHTWSAFLLAAFAAAWLWEWRHGRAAGRTGVLVGAATLVAWLPWLPSLLFQAAHTGAPWATAPAPYMLLAAPVVLGGGIGGPILLVAVAAALLGARRRTARPGRGAAAARAARAPGVTAGMLLAVGLGASTLAWAFNQAEPAWAARYLAICAGPLVVGAALAVRRVGWLPALVALVGVAWVAWVPAAERSNARALATDLAPQLRAGDAVISAGPQHVPVLAAYLPGGLRWSTPAGPVADTSVVDWRDLVARMAATPAASVERRAVAGLRRGGRVALFVPFEHRPSGAPLRVLTRVRATALADRLDADRRLRRVPGPATSLRDQRSSLRVVVWQRR